MTDRELLKLATSALVTMARAGVLSPRDFWTAAKGAARYRAAVLTGDVCADADARARAGVCAACPSHVVRDTGCTSGGVPASAGSCGPLLTDLTRTDPPTCGCLVTVTVGDAVLPAGKTIVASESCPQGRWGAAAARATTCPG